VQLLGSKAELSWTQLDDGLHIKLPSIKPDEPAFSFRILESSARTGGCGS
jgi:hypothetical protein